MPLTRPKLNSSDNRRGSKAPSVSVVAEGSPHSGSNSAGFSRSSGGHTRETKPVAVRGSSSIGRAPQNAQRGESSAASSAEVEGSNPSGRSIPRRNFDVEDVVGLCKYCGATIHADDRATSTRICFGCEEADRDEYAGIDV